MRSLYGFQSEEAQLQSPWHQELERSAVKGPGIQLLSEDPSLMICASATKKYNHKSYISNTVPIPGNFILFNQ